MTSERCPIDTMTPAVVLKFDPNVMHHGGLGVVRGLGRVGVPVYGVHEGPWAPVANSRYLAGRYFWQPSPGDVDRVLTGLMRLAEHIGQPSVLLTTDDAGAIFLAEHGQELRRRFLFPDPPPDLPRRLAGKYSLYQACRELDVPCPRAAIVGSLADAHQFASAVGYPLIAKLTTPWTASKALQSTSVVTGQPELDDLYRRCEQAGAGLMLQEFIPGGPGHDWFFHGYCDAASACRPAFTGVKDRSYPFGAGLTSLGRSTPNPELRDQVTALLRRLSYRGLLDLDIRLDARDGRYHLLDFNPRLGAQFRVFRDTAGTDVALAAYLDLTGQAIPDGEQVDGRAFLVENYDPLSALAGWRRGELSLRAWASSLRAVDETAWFARDDLRPFGLMCLRMGWRLVSRPLTTNGGQRGRSSPAGIRYRAGRAASGSGHALPGLAAGAAQGEAVFTQGGRGTSMSDVDVAVIGAGPYGLSLAAHLSAAGVNYRHFGVPMRLWRGAMPKGMFLKSQGFASNLSDPDGAHTLEAFCQAAGRPYKSYGLPVSLENFVDYGHWFQSQLDLKVEEVLVAGVAQRPRGFELTLADGERFAAGAIVVAIGVEHFAHVPAPLSALPAEACTHSSAHTDLAAFRGKQVAVVGAGQSALESAALLHENGATVQVLARRQAVAWNGQPLDPHRPLLRRLREPEAGLGSGWSTWFYSNHPDLFRRLPPRSRVYRARTALGPAGACWLRERVEGQFPVRTGTIVTSAKADNGKVRLGIAGTAETEVTADHVIAATGYRIDLKRLEFLPEALRSSLRTVGGSAAVGRDYQSSVPGLYFIGPSVAPSMGPVMRFVFGAEHAATMVGRHLVAEARGKSAPAMASGQ
jgi:predicted ATP-grasp superfamily ATP-dependent carboligase/cation diffusion facilitator CzcD-associated flavoprotein CzcO